LVLSVLLQQATVRSFVHFLIIGRPGTDLDNYFCFSKRGHGHGR
jgi:hypothetical protein